MGFDVAAESYDHFMGRYSRVLAPLFADFSGVGSEGRALDVGCGPGSLTTVLDSRLGAHAVSAVDPSEPFVAAVRERLPGVDVRLGGVEDLPFDSGVFDLSLAQLVVHHMADPVGGVREMARVTGSGGTVAACVWDHGGGVSPLGPFWEAVREFDPTSPGESDFPGAREGQLVAIFEAAGLGNVVGEALGFEARLEGFDDWWEPYPLGVGPAGQYVADLDPNRREELRELCRRLLPSGPFDLQLRVWAARGTAGG